MIILKLFCALMLDGFEKSCPNEEDEDTLETSKNEEEEAANTTFKDRGPDAQAYPVKGSQNFDKIKEENKKIELYQNWLRRDTIELRFDEIKHLGLEDEFVYFKNVETERSLFLFSKENKLRRFCYRVFLSTRFDSLRLVFIIFACVNISFETFVSDSDYKEYAFVSQTMNIVVNAFFTTDALIKIISHGFILKKSSYLRQLMNVIDSVAIVGFFLDVVTEDADFPAFRV